MPTKLKSGETILFIGDSITDCGRRGPFAPLGDGYVRMFADLLTLRESAKRVTVVNKGVSGNVVTQLQARWTDDVLRHRPDWLPRYIATVHAMSRKHRTRLVKTHEMFRKLLRHHEADAFCPEPVHPNATGHRAIAEAVYAALG